MGRNLPPTHYQPAERPPPRKPNTHRRRHQPISLPLRVRVPNPRHPLPLLQHLHHPRAPLLPIPARPPLLLRHRTWCRPPLKNDASVPIIADHSLNLRTQNPRNICQRHELYSAGCDNRLPKRWTDLRTRYLNRGIRFSSPVKCREIR